MWWLSRHTREKLLAQPFPAEWEQFLTRNVAYFRKLDAGQQTQIRDIVRVMVAEKNWEGCHGLAVSDEMKVSICGQAGLMILGMEHSYFDRVPTILVYPSGFRIPEDPALGDNSAVIGQAVYRGPVILAWDEILAQGRDPSQRENVVIHEFAHQLDYLDGYAGGTPELGNEIEVEHWDKVMERAYESHLHDLRTDRDTLLGEYAGTNRTEFFAVASERYFMVPRQFKRFYPELQELLAGYYRVDPAHWR
jgi:Mlc titration factor MtfA (ptsG expression regulator)